MKYKPTIIQTMLVAGCFFVGMGSSYAVPLPLEEGQYYFGELLEDEEIIIGDKIFYDWTLLEHGGVSEDILYSVVTALDDDPLNPGLKYDFFDYLQTDEEIGFAGIIWSFVVATIDESPRIKDNSLSLTDYTLDGDSGVYVYEYATDDIDLEIEKEVYAYSEGDLLELMLEETREFDPVNMLYVFNEAVAHSYCSDDTSIAVECSSASLHSFEQRFSQTSVPEPSIIALFAAGLFGIGFVRRRKA